MDEPKYIDLFISERNFTLNSGNEPRFCHNRVSISQDCVHAIIESGLATKLIAERSPTLRADIRTQIEIWSKTMSELFQGRSSLMKNHPLSYG